MPPKKKRGRPRKTETVVLQGEASALGASTTTTTTARKARVSQNDESAAAPTAGENNRAKVGQSVHGVVDGSFDAGFLVSLRVADSDTVYRGVVFGPGLSIPLNRENDVAPKVKNTNRSDDGTPLSRSVPSSSSTPPPPPLPVVPPAVVVAAPPPEILRGKPEFPFPPPSVSSYPSAPSAFRSSFDQELLNAQGFIYPGVPQIHPGHGFYPRGFGYPFHLPSADYAPGNPPFGADAQNAPSRHGS